MGCSNTINSKKTKIKYQKNKSTPGDNCGDSAGTNDGKSLSEERQKVHQINSKNLNDQEDLDLDLKNCYNIKLQPNTTEVMFPIWIEKNLKIKIHVRGLWSLFPEYGMVTSEGHSELSYKHRNLNIGCLVGRVQGGNYFPIKNGMILESEISGPLYLFANNSRFTIQPSGFLHIFLENVKSYPVEEIEVKLGWNIDELNTARNSNYLSKDEKDQIILLNKIKVNPKLFAQQYIKHLQDLGKSYQELYEKLVHYPKSQLLKPNKALYLAAKDHAIDLGENGTTGHISTDGSDLRNRLSRYTSSPIYFGENCSFNLKDPLSIVTQMIVDDGFKTRAHRVNIMNEMYNQIGISVKPHTSYKWICVQVFGNNIVENVNLSI